MGLYKHLTGVVAICMSVIALSAHAAPSFRGTSSPIRPANSAMAQAPKFKSYREWKNEKVSSAQTKVTYLTGQIHTQKTNRRASGTDPNLARGKSMEAVASQNISIEALEKQLNQEQYDLEVAKDLSVTDYFAGYLTKVPDKKAAFKDVAGKLSPEEIAELMNAYANSVFGAHASDLPASATNTTKESGR
ncbi:hypothetical protein ACLVWU_00545 [Bdellovibrio sp. HCB290]|uniref:hypothetical protein n=1 Tax=Bdellovibrio sp. HCB290 TaxID=3394356 RepID=UPI0039B60302